MNVRWKSTQNRSDVKNNMASILVANLSNGWSHSIQQDQEQAEKLLLGILERDPNNTRALGSLGILRRVQNRLDEARIEFETMIALDRNNTMPFRNLGLTLTQMGKPEEAIPYIEKSIRLSPHAPDISSNYGALGECQRQMPPGTKMGADEEGTHERLKAHLGELVNPKIAEYRGRIVKNTSASLPGGRVTRKSRNNPTHREVVRGGITTTGIGPSITMGCDASPRTFLG
jgi:tetratricopeptide (TPR) repeat protein